MKITVLIENTGPDQLIKEHGLSIYIEYKQKYYLLDSGSSKAFLSNAKILGVDLERVDKAILSHGHYDHGNGFSSYLEQYPNQKIYASEKVFEEYYSGSGNELHYIGLNKELKKMKNYFVEVAKDIKIDEDVYLVLDVKDFKRPDIDKKLYRKEKGTLVEDDFLHELSLVFDTEKGLVIFNSCSHSGLIHITEHIKEKFNKPVYAYIGGLHLKSSFSEEMIQSLAEYIQENICFVYTGHCTGELSYQKLKECLGNKIQALSTGKMIEI